MKLFKREDGAYVYELDSEEEVGDDANCFEKFMSKRVVKLVMFIVMICYGLFCVIVDWLWVADTLSVEKALVFGPPDTGITVTLIIVVSVGTISFIFEITNSVLKNCYGRTIIGEDIAEVITLFVEEIPTGTLNVLLAACREVPLSYYQLLKAALAMFSALFRGLRVLVRYFTARRNGKKTGFGPLFIRTVILLACLYVLFASIMVWIYTFYTPSGEFRTPDSIYSNVYDDGRYLVGSAVYLSHPIFSLCNGTLSWNISRQDWIKMEGIYDIQDSTDAQFDFFYDDNYTTTITRMQIVYENPDIPSQDIWYETIYPDCFTDPVDQVTDLPPNVIHFTFGSKEPDKTRVFGDITFRATVTENGLCQYLYTDDYGFLRTDSSDDIYAQFQYFQVFEEVDDNSTYYKDETDIFRPYRMEVEIQNVTDAWKTGYRECDMTGSLTPNLDEDLQVTCPSVQ